MFGITELIARLDRLEARVRTQDAAINQLCQRLGLDPIEVDPVSQVDAAERAPIAEGKPIAAMKHHRQRTGSSLSQAKQVIEANGGRR